MKAKSTKKREFLFKNVTEDYNSLMKAKVKVQEEVSSIMDKAKEKGKGKEPIRFKKNKFSNPSGTLKK